jgi:uncharacterized membrane protein
VATGERTSAITTGAATSISGVANEDAAAARPGEIRIGRLEAFSDGVFAIAITLLVLEITVPAGSEDDLLGAFFDQWRSYLAYAVSFATIGVLWLAHSAITDYVDRANSMLVRLNLLLLMVVSFIPFPTRLLAEYGGDEQAGRVATTVYGLTLIAAVLLTSVLWRYAVGAGLIRHDVSHEEIQVRTARLTPGLAGYVVMLALGLFVPTAAVFGYLAITIFLLVPFHLLRRRPAT